jgi:carbonic anhydrase
MANLRARECILVRLQLNFEGDAGSVTINGTVYYLKQLHWHSPTEHSVNGRRYDLELHMLHQSAEKKAAVIGVFYEIGAHDAFLNKVTFCCHFLSLSKNARHACVSVN